MGRLRWCFLKELSYIEGAQHGAPANRLGNPPRRLPAPRHGNGTLNSTSGQPSPEPPFAWVMVGVGFVLYMVAFGVLGSIGVFLKPLAAEFGWTRGDTALAYTVGAMSAGLGGIVMGTLSDRLPYRPMVLFGVQVLVGVLFMLSAQTALWHFYMIYCLLGLLGMSAILSPTINHVGQWFTRNPGLAIGLVSAGGGIGQGAIPYLARYLITLYGWRWAYVWMGIGSLALIVPLALLARTSPQVAERQEQKAGHGESSGEPPFPLPTPVVLPWLSLAVVFCCITMATPIVHVAALVSDKGHDPQAAAGVFGTIMVAGVLGRILIGPVADRIGGTRAYLISSLVQTVFVYGFIPLNSLPALYVLAAVYGLGYSAVMTCLLLCARELVPARIGGLSLGVVTCLGWTGMGLGGWQGGFFFDLTGDYRLSFAIAALTGVINLALIGGLHLYVKGKMPSLVPPLLSLQPATGD